MTDNFLLRIQEAYLNSPPPECWIASETDSALEAVEETEEFCGIDYRKLNLGLYEKYSRVFTFLPDYALPYYFGAYLYMSTKEKNYWQMAFDLIVADFFTADVPREVRLNRTFLTIVGELSPDQQSLASEYLDSVSIDSSDEQKAALLRMKKILG